jgi:hypothetical protein
MEKSSSADEELGEDSVETVVETKPKTRRPRKTPEQRALEKAAKKPVERKVKSENDSLSAAKREEKKIEAQAQKELKQAAKSKEEKEKERLERRKKINEVKATIVCQQAYANLPVNWPPADFWYLVMRRLFFQQKAKLRRVCKFFRLFLEPQWINESHSWITQQGFSPVSVFRLLRLKTFLPENDQKLVLKREELDQIEKEMIQFRPCPPALLRCIYKAFSEKRKNYSNANVIVRFYREFPDAVLYREKLLQHLKEIRTPLIYFSEEVLDMYWLLNLKGLLQKSIAEDNVHTFSLIFKHMNSKQEIELGNRTSYIDYNALFDLIWDHNALDIFEFLENANHKKMWMYPVNLVKKPEFPEFFHSSLAVTDVIPLYDNLRMHNDPEILQMMRRKGYRLWQANRECDRDYIRFLQVFTRDPSTNPWVKDMHTVNY